MQRLGKVEEWNDERGFGFIAPLELSKDGGRAFFHIRDYQQQGRRPEPGELVKYAAQRQADGKWRATQVMRAAQPSAKAKAPSRKPTKPDNPYTTRHDLMRTSLVLGYAAFLAWAIAHDLLPFEFTFVPALMSIITFMAYAADKHSAQRGHWRIPEGNLHLMELLCGWPGALLAQRVLHHKTRKASYRAGFWMMVVLNLGATAAWIYWKP